MRYFLKDDKGNIVNNIVWNGVSDWTLPAKYTIEPDTRPTSLESTPVTAEQIARGTACYVAPEEQLK